MTLNCTRIKANCFCRLCFLFILAIISGASALAQPSIQYFTPESGPVGQTISIYGYNFNPVAANNFVYFGGAKATILSASATMLTVTVPNSAGYAPITVTANQLTAFSARPFTVTFNDGANAFTDSSFYARISFPTNGQPNTIAAADFNGDGKIDLVEVSLLKAKVSIFQNSSTVGAISLQPSMDFLTGANPYDIAIGDLNGDGKQDIVVTNDGSTAISIFQNTSVGGIMDFGPNDVLSAISHPYSVTIGDVDGDGKLDIVVVNAGAHTLSIYRNRMLLTDTLASFDPPVNFNTGNTPYYVRMADFDGDGKIDIAVPNWAASNISVFKNISTPGNIALAPSVEFPTGKNPSSVTIADYDGDGLADMAVSNMDLSTNSVSVLRNVSTSSVISFSPMVSFGTGSSPGYARSADMNGDGKPDIVVSNAGYPYSVSILKNTSRPGSVSFAAQAYYTTGTGPMAGAIVDMDGDNKPDIVVPDYGDNTMSILRNALHSAGEPNIYSINPDSARMGDSVMIHGIHFTGTTGVRFGDQLAGYVQVISDSLIKTFVGAGLTGTVAVTNALGTGIYNRFVYVALPPVISSFTPITGKPGDTILISGSHFTGATALGFGGNPAVSFNVINDSTTWAIVNHGASGSVSIATPFGSSSLPGFFFVDTLKAPVIISCSPMYGAPGNYVAITGKHFSKITSLSFGGTPAAAIVIYSDTFILATIGNGASGMIYITNNAGADSLNGFVFIPPPSAPKISSFNPDSATNNGLITINGKHFNGTTQVLFGGRAAAGYTVVDDSLIIATVNDGSSGAVSVINAIGTDSLNGFTYFAPAGPVIYSFTPGSGWRGDTITIYGAHFTGATYVAIGGYTTIFNVISDSVITFIVGGGTTGDVVVQTPYGTADMPGFLYQQYTNPPIVDSFAPISGKTGDLITIYGKRFTGLYSVSFGGIPAGSYTLLNDSTIQAIVWTGASGDISISATAGMADATGFEYIPSADTGFVFNSFTALPSGTNVRLNWQTEQEQSILTYYVERSGDSISFGIIDSISSLGTYYLPVNYTDLDMHVPNGKVYYKIGALDTLGILKYSGVLSVGQAKAVTNSIKLYPNPTTNYLYVQYPVSPNSGVVKILDMNGIIIQTFPIEPNSSIVRITFTLAPGVYVISWSDGVKVLSNTLQVR